MPLFESARHGHAPSPDEVRELADYIASSAAPGRRALRHRRRRRERTLERGRPHRAAPGGRRHLVGRTPDAVDPDHYRAEPVLRRVEAGPPRL